jgi:6-phosphogluconolactonase
VNSTAKPELRVLPDAAALARAAAEELARRAAEAAAVRGNFALALAGGSTPRALYSLLADPGEGLRDRIPWHRTQVFWGDERHVPPGDPDSNYRMASEALLSHVPVAAASVHRIRGELPDAARAAAEYEEELRRALRPMPGEVPRFDLVLLGMGPDGHTASLFPGSPALAERERWVAAPFVERLGTHRITLTLPVLEGGRAVLFVVAGAEKAGVLAKVLEGGGEGLPAALVRPRAGELVWLVDRAAAAGLRQAG